MIFQCRKNNVHKGCLKSYYFFKNIIFNMDYDYEYIRKYYISAYKKKCFKHNIIIISQ